MINVILLILAALGGLAFLKVRKANIEKKLEETRIKDEYLKAGQRDIKLAIKDLDKGIDDMKREKEMNDAKIKEDSLTLKERRDRLRGKLK